MPRFLLLALAILIVAGPQTGRGEDKKPDPFTYPLAVGTAWTYRVGENRYKMTVTKTEKVGKTDCARLEMKVGDKVVSFEHVAIEGGKLARYSFEGKPIAPPIVFLEVPPAKGKTWKVESKIDGQVLKGSFVIGEEKVKVAGGTFDTFTVTSQGLQVNGVKATIKYYFATGVGMVKKEIEMAGPKVVFELEKYEPGKS